jgi:predicted oxidoreductase
MIQQGKAVKQVLRIQISGFDNLDPYGRYLAEKGLRAALARRTRVSSELGARPRH